MKIWLAILNLLWGKAIKAENKKSSKVENKKTVKTDDEGFFSKLLAKFKNL